MLSCSPLAVGLQTNFCFELNGNLNFLLSEGKLGMEILTVNSAFAQHEHSERQTNTKLLWNIPWYWIFAIFMHHEIYIVYSRCANSNVIPTYKKMTGITLLFGTFLVARGWIYCINTVCNFLPPSVNYLKSTCSNYTNAGLLINYLFILVQHTLHLQTIAFFF